MATMTKSARTSKPKTAKPADTFSLALAINHIVYVLERIDGGEDHVRAFRLVKKSADGAVYDVAQGKDGINRCDCPDYVACYEGTLGQCKHLRAACAMGLIDAPSWKGPAEKPAPKPLAASVPTVPPVVAESDEPANILAEPVEAPEPAESFADDLVKAIGPDPLPIRANVGPATVADAGCCEPGEPVACASCVPTMTSMGPLTWYPSLVERGLIDPPKHEVPPAVESFATSDEAQAARNASPHGGKITFGVDGEWLFWPAAEVEPDPLVDLPFPRSTRRIVEKAPGKVALPVKPSPLPPGTYTLAEIVDGQAAMFRGMGTGPAELIANTLADLAAKIRFTGAASVSQFEGRIAEMEADRDERIRSDGFDQGYMVGSEHRG